MDPVDRTLTYSIVGAPMSLVLGRRQVRSDGTREGIQTTLRETGWQLTQGWLNWWTLHPADEFFVGVRQRPNPMRRWLERYALMLGLLAGAVLTAEIVVAVVWLLNFA